ncbi:MAG: hypothetical protein OXI10_06240, partial [Gammaproteobacteria bacterium]|nr:hypothetical protein [Gammaproteobacteria bacterium]
MSADNQWKARHLREGRELLRNSIERMNRYGVAVETCDAVTEHQLARILDRLESCRRCLGHLIDECETKT